MVVAAAAVVASTVGCGDGDEAAQPPERPTTIALEILRDGEAPAVGLAGDMITLFRTSSDGALHSLRANINVGGPDDGGAVPMKLVTLGVAPGSYALVADAKFGASGPASTATLRFDALPQLDFADAAISTEGTLEIASFDVENLGRSPFPVVREMTLRFDGQFSPVQYDGDQPILDDEADAVRLSGTITYTRPGGGRPTSRPGE